LNCKAYPKFKEADDSENINIFRKINKLVESSEKWTFFFLFIALLCINVTFFITYATNNYNVDLVIHGVFLTFNKVLFVIGIGIIVQLTFLQKFNFIFQILSLDFFNVMGKLTFGVYVVHLYVISLLYTSTDSTNYFSTEYFIFISIGVFVISIILSLVMSLLFESPVIGLMKEVLDKK
jgi:peptidoglycan/LPS O-acetylase OafA/YrhL